MPRSWLSVNMSLKAEYVNGVVNMSNSLGSVKCSQIEKALASIKRGPVPDPDITFEFMMSSLFPNVVRNVENNLKREYDRGFREGYAAASDMYEKLP